MTGKVTVAFTDEMMDVLEKERKIRRLGTISETVRAILGKYAQETWPIK